MNNDKASRAIFELAAAQLKEQAHKFGVEMNIEFTDNPSTSEDGVYIDKATLERFGFHTYPRTSVGDAIFPENMYPDGGSPRHPQPAGAKFGDAAKKIKEAIVDPKRVPEFLRAKPQADKNFLRVSDERKLDPYAYTEVRFPTKEVYPVLLDVLKKAVLMAQNTGFVVIIRSFTEYEQTETPLACPGQEAYWADVDRSWGQMYVGDFVQFACTAELDSLFRDATAAHELNLARVEFKKTLKSLLDAEEEERPLPSVGVLSNLSKPRPHVQLHFQDLAIGVDLQSRLAQAVGMAHETGFKVEVARDKLHLTNDEVGPFTSAPASLRLFVNLEGPDFSWLSDDWRKALYDVTVSISAGVQRNSPKRVFGESDIGYGGLVRPGYASAQGLAQLMDRNNPGSGDDHLVNFYKDKPSAWFNTVEGREHVFATDKLYSVSIASRPSIGGAPPVLEDAIVMAKTSGFVVEFQDPTTWTVTTTPLSMWQKHLVDIGDRPAQGMFEVRDCVRYNRKVLMEDRLIADGRNGQFGRVHFDLLKPANITFTSARMMQRGYGIGLGQARDHLLAKKEGVFAPMAERNETLPETALARAFRSILIGRDIGPVEMEKLVNNYVRRNGTMHFSEYLAARNNVNKELSREHMSWNTFCKGLSVLGIEDFALRAEIGRNVRQVVKVPVDLSEKKPGGLDEAAQAATLHADSHTLRVAAITSMYLKDHGATRDQLSTMWGSLFTQLLIEAKIDDAELFAKITAYFDAQSGNEYWPRDMVSDLVAEASNETMKYESFVLFLDILGMQSPQLCVMGPMEVDGMDDLMHANIYIDGISIGGTEEEDSGEEVVLPKEQLISTGTDNVNDFRSTMGDVELTEMDHPATVDVGQVDITFVNLPDISEAATQLLGRAISTALLADRVVTIDSTDLKWTVSEVELDTRLNTVMHQATYPREVNKHYVEDFVILPVDAVWLGGWATVDRVASAQVVITRKGEAAVAESLFNDGVDMPDILFGMPGAAHITVRKALRLAKDTGAFVHVRGVEDFYATDITLTQRLQVTTALYGSEEGVEYIRDYIEFGENTSWLGKGVDLGVILGTKVVFDSKKGVKAPAAPTEEKSKGVMTYRPLHDGYVDFIAKVSQEDVLINGKPIQGQWPMFIEFALKVARAENKRVRVISPERIAVLAEDAMRPGAKRRKHMYVNDFLDLAPEFEGAIALDEDAVASYKRLMRSRVDFK